MNALRRVSAVALLSLGIGSSFACAANVDSSAPTETSQYPDGLTIVEADASIGKLVAVFKIDGRAVKFHLRQGAPMQNPPPEGVLAPSSEIDARVTDQEGRPMSTQMGGDEFIEPGWKMESSAGVNAEVRTADFARAFAARDAFIAWKAPAGLEQLRLGAIAAARINDPSIDTKPSQGAAKLPTGEQPALGTKVITSNNTVNPSGEAYSYYYWDYSIWAGSIAGFVGEHSAVRLNLYNPSKTRLQHWESCNHGRCAADTDSGMNRKCLSADMYDSNDTRYFYGEGSKTQDNVSGGCLNRYKWSAVDGHNCHNDTRLQRYAIATGSVGLESRYGNYGSLCSEYDQWAKETCPTSF